MQSESTAIRKLIEEFLQDRLQGKLETEEKNLAKAVAEDKKSEILEKIDRLRFQFEREVWLESAATRVSQLQLVHFAAKFTNPSSKGSSRYLPQDARIKNSSLVCTVTSNGALEPDVVGNAAALDVFKFLSLRIGPCSLLDRVLRGCEKLEEAFSNNPEMSKSWSNAFAAIAEDKLPIESNQYGKQTYFPVPGSQYHLLAPLFPTSFVHGAYDSINNDRFWSEESKVARKARREGQWCSHGYADYKNLTIQNFGGTKPQNISQLNSQRGGKAVLLASCPPTWSSEAIRPPKNVETIFKRWLSRHKSLREQTKKLRDFLSRTDYNNAAIRRARARMVEGICDEVLVLASNIQALEPGWSVASTCRLDSKEAMWLDPYRGQHDIDFRALRASTNWQQEVAGRFARWLNAALKTKTQVLGDAEFQEWKTHILREIGNLPLEAN